ncbi:MAG: iron export ABC transporter permease subunit FetB [Planctomycetota bacterium]
MNTGSVKEGLDLLGQGTVSSQSLDLAWWQVGVAATLILIHALVSWRMHLGLGRKVLWSGFRLVVQLTLLGLVLHQIFALSHFAPVLGLGLVMTVIAGLSAVDRVSLRYDGIRWTAIFAVWVSSWFTTGIAVLLIVQPKPWFSPQVLIPLLGMVLGNSLTGISLGMDRLLSDLKGKRDEIETMLALGATRSEATRELMMGATSASMIPILYTMSVAGIVIIPGMMNGQLLAGAAPIQAVKYQIMIMFVIAAAIALGVLISLQLTRRLLTTKSHQIAWDRLR